MPEAAKAPEAKAIIRATRRDDYELRVANGFTVRNPGGDNFILETFVDYPPIERTRINDGQDLAFVIERRFIDGYAISREELKRLAQSLLDAANAEPADRASIPAAAEGAASAQ